MLAFIHECSLTAGVLYIRNFVKRIPTFAIAFRIQFQYCDPARGDNGPFKRHTFVNGEGEGDQQKGDVGKIRREWCNLLPLRFLGSSNHVVFGNLFLQGLRIFFISLSLIKILSIHNNGLRL